MLEQRRRPLTPQERLELQIYYELEPFGARRDDLRFGMLLTMLYNGLFKRRQDPAAVQEDFVLFDPDLQVERETKRERIRAKFRRAVAAFAKAMKGQQQGAASGNR